MTRHGRSRGQHRRVQPLAEPARRPERVREPSRLQRTLHARRLGAHVRPPAGPGSADVRDDDPVGAAYEPHQPALGTALPAPQTRARRDMLHASVDAGSAPSVSDADGADASALGAGSRRAASHSSAAA
jgi:hypothetical protein